MAAHVVPRNHRSLDVWRVRCLSLIPILYSYADDGNGGSGSKRVASPHDNGSEERLPILWRQDHEKDADNIDRFTDGCQHGNGCVHSSDQPGVDEELLEEVPNALCRNVVPIRDKLGECLREDSGRHIPAISDVNVVAAVVGHGDPTDAELVEEAEKHEFGDSRARRFCLLGVVVLGIVLDCFTVLGIVLDCIAVLGIVCSRGFAALNIDCLISIATLHILHLHLLHSLPCKNARIGLLQKEYAKEKSNARCCCRNKTRINSQTKAYRGMR